MLQQCQAQSDFKCQTLRKNLQRADIRISNQRVLANFFFLCHYFKKKRINKQLKVSNVQMISTKVRTTLPSSVSPVVVSLMFSHVQHSPVNLSVSDDSKFLKYCTLYSSLPAGSVNRQSPAFIYVFLVNAEIVLSL